jgi:hypothetical protein
MDCTADADCKREARVSGTRCQGDPAIYRVEARAIAHTRSLGARSLEDAVALVDQDSIN